MPHTQSPSGGERDFFFYKHCACCQPLHCCFTDVNVVLNYRFIYKYLYIFIWCLLCFVRSVKIYLNFK